MNTSLSLDSDFLRNLSIIAEDKDLLSKAVKYIRRLAAKKADPTLMSKEEFIAKIEKAELDYSQGNTYAMLPGESFSDFRNRIGQ